jgi:hypothetical protein
MILMPIVYVSDMERSMRSTSRSGSSLIVRDPDGLEIQVNEHDRSLHA